MKKSINKISFIAIFAMFVCSMGFTSCNKDDDSGSGGDSGKVTLMGKWECTMVGFPMNYDFKQDGTVNTYIPGDGKVNTYTTTYVYNEDKKTLLILEVLYKCEFLDKNTMILTPPNTKTEYTFKKVTKYSWE